MATLQAFRDSIRTTFGMTRTPPDVATLRELCVGLLDDVPAGDRKIMLHRLGQMRRADDVWHLRSALFDVISRVHGEAVARKRLVTLDACLK